MANGLPRKLTQRGTTDPGTPGIDPGDPLFLPPTGTGVRGILAASAGDPFRAIREANITARTRARLAERGRLADFRGAGEEEEVGEEKIVRRSLVGTTLRKLLRGA